MGVLIDILGAVIIGGLLLIMLITFNYQLANTAERNMYAAQMTEHMESACMRLNYIIGLAGAGVSPSTAVIDASEEKFVFKTYWDFETDKLEEEGYYMEPTQGDPIQVAIMFEESASPYGGAIQIVREGVTDPVEDLGYIFWVDAVEFRYYDINDNLMDESFPSYLKRIRAVEMFLTFERPGPLIGDRPLTNSLQLKCYMMNAYMQEGLL
jgi:hypothetical protein